MKRKYNFSSFLLLNPWNVCLSQERTEKDSSLSDVYRDHQEKNMGRGGIKDVERRGEIDNLFTYLESK